MLYRTRQALAIALVATGILAIQSTAQAQGGLPTWHDVERAVRPQDLPVIFRTPSETQSTFTDPPSTYSNYRIGFDNESSHPVRVYCVVFKDGKWSGNWDQFWTLKPKQRTALFLDKNTPLLATRFRYLVTATDGSGVVWDHKNADESVGKPYETYGGTEVWSVTLVDAPAGGLGLTHFAANRRVWKHSGGFFKREGLDKWVEKNGKATYKFTEKERDDDHIDLYDAGRDYTVRLTKDAMYIRGGNDRVNAKFPQFEKLYNGSWESK